MGRQRQVSRLFDRGITKKKRGAGFDPWTCFFFWFRFFFPGDCKTKDLGTSRTNQPTEEQTHKQTNKQANTPAKQETNHPGNKTRRDRRNQGEIDATKQELARKNLEGFFGTKGSKRSCKFPLFNIIKAGVGCSEWAPRCWDYYGEPTRSWSSVS